MHREAEEPERQIAHTKKTKKKRYLCSMVMFWRRKATAGVPVVCVKWWFQTKKRQNEQNGEQTVGSEAWNNYALKTPGWNHWRRQFSAYYLTSLQTGLFNLFSWAFEQFLVISQHKHAIKIDWLRWSTLVIKLKSRTARHLWLKQNVAASDRFCKTRPEALSAK